MFPRSWRFLATLDPQVLHPAFPDLSPKVDLMVSRDLDSRLTMREVAAVREWEESGAALHVMRDHPQVAGGGGSLHQRPSSTRQTCWPACGGPG